VRKADTFAQACIQPWAGNPEPNLPSEDCLYLNVWTATLEHFGIARRYMRPPAVSFRDGQMKDVAAFYRRLGLS